MSAVANLLMRRQKLLEQLESATAQPDREEIERQLEQIEMALELLEWLPSSKDPGKP